MRVSQNPVFIPGPTNMPEHLRKACDLATIDHRGPGFAKMMAPTLSGVKTVLGLDAGEVLVFPATGTGAWEAAMTNTLSPGDTVLAARFGMFSHRWIDLCRRHGLKVEVIETPWGEGAPIDKIEARLASDKSNQIKAVLVTHNETATGVKSDVAGVRRAMDGSNHPAMLFVDGVSSIASMPFAQSDWGVDIAITGSQKGFMLPAGLAIMGLSPKALKATESAALNRCYFDFGDMLGAIKSGGFPYTPPVGLINGLSVAVQDLLEEGLPQVYARHTRIADGVRAAVHAWGLTPFAADPSLNSDTVTAVKMPEGIDGTAVVTRAAQRYDMAFGVGLGEVAGKVFRIGHLGQLSEALMLSGISVAEMCMVDVGLDIQLGSGVAAAQDVYRQSDVPMVLAAE